jgi:nucleoside-diphosphate-sugar epimerase
MNCLVTGAAGFIGSNLVKRLEKEKYQVKALIHVKHPEIVVNNVEYVHGDITNKSFVLTLIKDIDVVFHCASIVKDFGPKNRFYQVNLEGTKNLVEASEKHGVKQFIFLSHLMYESKKRRNHYSKTKLLAEQYIKEKNRKYNFPFVIIRPGNVYGPGDTTWVLRPLHSIKKHRIALINGGKGIFLHTYIDNLIDALIAVLHEPKAIGQTIEITDGDNSITWGNYLNDLSSIVTDSPIKKDISKKNALLISNVMLLLHKIFRFEPWITPTSVEILTNQQKIFIKKAKDILGYKPRIGYLEGMKRIKKWLRDENYIKQN